MYPVKVFVVDDPESLLSGLQLVLERDMETLNRGGLGDFLFDGEHYLTKVSWQCFDKNFKHLQQAIVEAKDSSQVILYADCLPDFWCSYLLRGISAFVAIKNHQELPLAIYTTSLGGLYLSQEYKNCFRRTQSQSPGLDRMKSQLGLTEMELKVINEIAQDRSNREIAESLYISERTVEYHISSAMRKVGVKSRVGLVVKILKLIPNDG